jgi:hypothetical protein
MKISHIVVIILYLLIPNSGKAQCSKNDIQVIAVQKGQQKYPRQIIINLDIFEQFDKETNKFIDYYIILYTNQKDHIIRLNCKMDCSCSQPYAITLNE